MLTLVLWLMIIACPRASAKAIAFVDDAYSKRAGRAPERTGSVNR